jgi:hypothetical protein
VGLKLHKFTRRKEKKKKERHMVKGVGYRERGKS